VDSVDHFLVESVFLKYRPENDKTSLSGGHIASIKGGSSLQEECSKEKKKKK
jgi:hypothetical protein